MPINILICDHVGLFFGEDGNPDPSEVKDHIQKRGGTFRRGPLATAGDGRADILRFSYQPELSTHAELLGQTASGFYEAVIAAATLIAAGSRFSLGGVRIGAGTGNMGSASWGGPNGSGGEAPLMNTPGFNARATAQMTMKTLLHFRPSLPLQQLHNLTVSGQFDTGKDLQRFPSAKLEGQVIAIFGYGNIGRELAKLAAAFGMIVRVFARAHHHARILSEGFIPFANPLDAARGADVISVHTGLGALDAATGRFANQGLVDAQILNALNQKSTVLNFDRGECVDAAALGAALASGQVAHAAIDADIFTSGGKLTGPMVPYLALAEKFGARILLLPHAAADTDHPSRVAGAKQAVDQIFDAIQHKRVVNLKGDLPPGYINGGVKRGI